MRTLSERYSRLETLFNRVNFESLKAEHENQNKHKAVGVDKVTKEEYKQNLDKNLQDLLIRNIDFEAFMMTLNRKLRGTNNYYSVSGALNEVKTLYAHAFWVVLKWMNRRGQRQSFTADKFSEVWKKKIKKPYVHVNIWGYGGVIYN